MEFPSDGFCKNSLIISALEIDWNALITPFTEGDKASINYA